MTTTCPNCGHKLSDKRTLSQNASMWLFCKWIANMFNEVGELYINPMGIESIWTEKMVMETYWRPLQIQLYDKKSSTKLNIDEISPIADAIIMHFANKGYYLEFPNLQSFLNKMDKFNYK